MRQTEGQTNSFSTEPFNRQHLDLAHGIVAVLYEDT